MKEAKDDILAKAFDKAKKYEMRSGGCAQCTLAGIFDALGVEDEGVFKAATGPVSYTHLTLPTN